MICTTNGLLNKKNIYGWDLSTLRPGTRLWELKATVIVINGTIVFYIEEIYDSVVVDKYHFFDHFVMSFQNDQVICREIYKFFFLIRKFYCRRSDWTWCHRPVLHYRPTERSHKYSRSPTRPGYVLYTDIYMYTNKSQEIYVCVK